MLISLSYILIYSCIVAAIFVLSWFLFGFSSVKLSPEVKTEIRKGAWYKSKDETAKKPLIFTRLLFPPNRFIISKLGRQKLENRLYMAELSLLPEDFMGIQEALIIAMLLSTFVTLKRLEPMFVFIILGIGFILPNLYVNRKIQKRKQQIVKALPNAIDLISLCVGGGLEFMVGLSWVVARYPYNPLIKEFSRIIHDVKMGMSRQEALKDMAKRLNTPEISSFVNALVHAHRMGTPIADVLNILSEEARRQRFQRGERKALIAPIKMLFPLVLFIMPVVAIIVAGPVLIQFTKGGLPKF